MKGHASRGDVQQGRAARQDKVGNAKADGLANEGREAHEGTTMLQRAANERKEWSEAVHASMLEILKAHEERRAEVPFLYDFINHAVPQLHALDILRVMED